MKDTQKQLTDTAAYHWELGMLLFLYEKGLITEAEYHGIRKIATEQATEKKLCPI